MPLWFSLLECGSGFASAAFVFPVFPLVLLVF
jgi:hypothetical protein